MATRQISVTAVEATLSPLVIWHPVIVGGVVGRALVELTYYGVFTVPPRFTRSGFPETVWLKQVKEA